MSKRKSALDKALEQAFAILEKNKVDTTKMEKPDPTLHNYRSGDAVAIFGHAPKHFIPGRCKECGRPFAHNRPARVGSIIGFCSDPCRRDNWLKTTGVPWAALSTNDVWNGDPPMIITPDQFERLQEIARWFDANRTTLQSNLRQPEVEQQEPPESQEILESQVRVQEQGIIEVEDIFAQENLHQGEVHTSLQSSPVLEVEEQMFEVDDFFPLL